MLVSYPTSFDAYLRYAIQTNFAYFGGPSEDTSLMLLVKLKGGVDGATLLVELNKLKPFERGPAVFAGHGRQTTSFVTVRGSVDIVGPKTWEVWELLTDYVELSVPVQAKFKVRIEEVDMIDKDRPKSQSETVRAIIDDGCAFAHERFRVNFASTKSRVFAIWDQNKNKLPSQPKVGGSQFGVLPKDFKYGLEYRRTPPTSSKEIGIDDWIDLHLTPTGAVNEEACYREAGFDSLQCCNSHGVHVMDVFAGSVPPSSRLSYDPKNPPSFVAENETADIIFVQIPREGVDDPSGRWLSTQVHDAMNYILSCVDPAVTKRLVVNLSYGPTTDPHDGHGNLEEALSQLTAHYDGSSQRPKLDIALPAGNSRLTEGHVVFKSTDAGEKKTWTWRAPPDNPVPIFVELWVPRTNAADVSGWLRSPSPIPSNYPQPEINVTAGSPISYCWMIALPPTQASPSAPLPGPHGDWTIEVTLHQPGVELHAYVARSDPDMGSRVASKQSRFIDQDWESQYGAFADQTLKDGARDTSGSCVVKAGTLSGIATASDGQVHVAGGYRLNDGTSSPYSSLGPSRADRKGPDYALPSDEAPALLGIRAAGTRSGGTFRLIGTSTAAPQLARRLLGTSPPVTCSPYSQTPDFGCGKLPAP